MATGDTMNGLGGDVTLASGSILNVKRWTLTSARNIKKYAVAGNTFKRAVGGTIEQTGTIEVEIEEGERSPELSIKGATVTVSLLYKTGVLLAGKIVIENVQEGVNLDDGQIDTLVCAFSADGELVPTGVEAGGSAE